MVTNKTPEGGESDAKLLSAMLDYLEKAKAGTGKVVANGAVVNVELAASGAEMSTLIKTGGAALFPRGTNVGAKVTAGPVDCQMLADAVQQYMQEALAASAEDKKQENADMVARVLPPLQKAYVASCEADKWTADVISCHVDNAKNLPRFERCRMLLPDGPRAAFDTAVGLVLDKEMTPPAAGTGAGSAGAGSGT